MIPRETEQNGQGTVPPVTAHSIEAVAGAPDTRDATSLLSYAAWTDAAFRADVIRERVENPHRTPAREPGLDAEAVVEECRRARNVRAIAGAGFIGAALVLVPFNLPAALTALLTALLAVLLGPAAPYRAVLVGGRPPGNVLGWLVLTVIACVVGLYFVWPYFSGLLSAPSPGSGVEALPEGYDRLPDPDADTYGSAVGGLIPFWLALLLLLAVTVGIGYWMRSRTNITLNSIREHAETPWRSSGVGTVPVAFYNGFMPFVGTGVHHGSWPVTLELAPLEKDRPHAPEEPAGTADPAAVLSTAPDGHSGDDPARKAPSVTDAALVEGLYARLRTELPKLSGTEEVRSGTRREVEVADCVFLPGLRQDDVTDLVPVLVDPDRRKLREEWVSGLAGASHERVRHFLEVGVSMWEGQIVVTAFVRLSVRGGLLHIEGETMILPPVSREYRIPSDPLPTDLEPGDMPQLLWESFLGVVNDLWNNSAETAAWLRSRYAADRNRGKHDRAREHGEFFDYSPRMGLRERSATGKFQQLFQSHDVRRVTRGIQGKVLSCVLDVLKEAGYDTGEVSQVIQNIHTNYNSQVFGGQQNITGPNANVAETTFNSPGHGTAGPKDTGVRTTK
ncbi:hypothetical protein [Nocardiopsis quinghaiensis]|uniref:hypothetical protein n=1 Tax=Nocardiopsis quinghaiensis TaxID=464995 RepID=UPI00123A1888|nr:hypothetical protein [Nocardiopsis quinghaiensis]